MRTFNIKEYFLDKTRKVSVQLYGHGGYLGDIAQFICIHFHFHPPIRFHMKFGCN